MTQVAAVAISALKLLAVLLKYKFPKVSAFFALTNAKSPKWFIIKYKIYL
jgi:hypothetical protein